MLFNWTKRANFRGSHLFQATHNIQTEEQTINSLSLKKSETEVTASILKKDPKYTRD